jgi:formylglycine-generating enzyme required for sulfatase activity
MQFEKGRTRDLFAVLDPKAPLKGRLYVDTQPEDASVMILNIGQAFNQGMALDAGRYQVEVSADGYETQKMWVSFTAGQDKTLDIHLKPIDTYQPGSQGKKISNSLGMEFVYIAPGTFMMSSPLDEPGRDNDEKLHRVTLTKGFYIQITEVTQRQWKAIMGSNPSYLKNCGEECSVENVSWNDVQQFIRKLNQREGRYTYRLPTEAEWEYAARAGSKTAFAIGDISETGCGYDSNLDVMGWYCGNSGVSYSGCYDMSKWGGPRCAGTHPVAQKMPNAWGLYDMHGNVWEWCQDWYGNYPSGSVTNPTGPSGGSNRVARGGSWGYSAGYCRSARRGWSDPDLGFNYLGLRLVMTLD